MNGQDLTEITSKLNTVLSFFLTLRSPVPQCGDESDVCIRRRDPVMWVSKSYNGILVVFVIPWYSSYGPRCSLQYLNLEMFILRVLRDCKLEVTRCSLRPTAASLLLRECTL